MPVFSVGVGKERLTRDVQVTRAETPRRVLKGASLVVDVVVTQTGYAGAKVPLIVEDDGRTVSTQEITLPADGESQTVKVRFKAGRRRAANVPLPYPGAGRMKKSRRTTSATRSIDVYNRTREDSVSRRRAAARSRSSSGRRPRRTTTSQVVLLQRTAEATVERPGQVPAASAWTRPRSCRTDFRRRAQELFDYRAHHSRQRRSGGVHARPAADARGFRATCAAAACSRSAGCARSAKAAGRARRCPTRCRSCSTAAAPKPLSSAARSDRPADARRPVASGDADRRQAEDAAGQVAGTAAADGRQRRAR